MVRLKRYDARRLSQKPCPSIPTWTIETWVIHKRKRPGESVAQVQIVHDHVRGEWFAWTGNLIRRDDRMLATELAEKCAESC